MHHSIITRAVAIIAAQQIYAANVYGVHAMCDIRRD